MPVFRQGLIVAAVVLAAHLAGLFTAADRWVVCAVESLRSEPARESIPLVIAIDEATIRALGPPPWSAEQWVRIGEALHDSGIDQAWMVDPWTSLALAEAAPATDAPRARIRVPRLVVEDPEAPGIPRVLEPPVSGVLEAWDHQLSLPAHEDGVIRDLSAAAKRGGLFGPSAFCAWAGRCPGGRELTLVIRTPREPGTLPTLSLADVLDGRVRSDGLPASQRPVLLGVTDAFRARHVRVGPRPLSMTWPEAVASAIATARVHLPMRRPGPFGESVLVLVMLAVALLLTRLERIAGTGVLTVVFPPLLATGLAVESVVARAMVPPITALVLVAAVPPLISALASRGVARDFLRSVALALAQDGLRYAWRDARIRTPEALGEKVALVTATRFAGCRGAYLHRTGRHALSWLAGSLARDGLAGELTLQARLFSDARGHGSGVRAHALVPDARGARLVPLYDRHVLAGFWVLAWDDDSAAPDPGALAEVAGWLGRHLALDQAPAQLSLREWLRDRLESDTDAVRDLFGTASEERRRQLEALQAIELPLLTADPAGAVLFANPAMAAVLEAGGAAGSTTLGELAPRLDAHAANAAALQQLFTAGEPLTLQWRDDHRSYRAVIRPVSVGGDGDPMLGFVMHAEDRSHVDQLEQVRGTVVDFTTTRVRNALMVVVGYAGLLKGKATEPADAKMLDTVRRNAEEVAAAMDELKALVALDAEPDRLVEVDVGRILREVVAETSRVAAARDLQVDVVAPEVSLPAMVPPARARHAFAILLHEACASAALHSKVRVVIEERATDTLFRLTWSGAGFDPEVLASVSESWPADLAALPRELHPFARARAVFGGLRLTSGPGEGVDVLFTLERPGRA